MTEIFRFWQGIQWAPRNNNDFVNSSHTACNICSRKIVLHLAHETLAVHFSVIYGGSARATEFKCWFTQLRIIQCLPRINANRRNCWRSPASNKSTTSEMYWKGYSTIACTPFFLKITMRWTCPLGALIVCNTSCNRKEKCTLTDVCEDILGEHFHTLLI